MKTVKEIKKEADLLYGKSSHYIAGTFLAISTIVAFAKSALQIIGLEIGWDYLLLVAVIFSPLEYGMIKATLLAYDHEARKVDTVDMTLSGLKSYFKIMVPFIGRTILIYAVQALIVAFFVFLTTRSFDDLAICLNTVLTGQMDNIRVDGQLVIYGGAFLGIIIAIVVGFVLEAYFSLSYYYVVEKNMGLIQSLRASGEHMKGNFWQYILLRLNYLPYAIVSAIAVNIVSIAFRTMFQQLLTLLPTVPLIVFNLLLAAIVAFVSALISVMIYKVKESLAITIFYKEVNKE